MTVLLARFQPALRVAFLLAATATLIVALAPMTGPSVGDSDKVQHFLAFYVLTLMGAAAYPRRGATPWVAAGLLIYGALIEVLQAVTPYGRTPDLKDWLADALGIAAVLAPLQLAAWRDKTAASPQ